MVTIDVYRPGDSNNAVESVDVVATIKLYK